MPLDLCGRNNRHPQDLGAVPEELLGVVRNTKAFKEAVAQTLAELARRGVTRGPATVADTVESTIIAVADHMGIQVRSA